MRSAIFIDGGYLLNQLQDAQVTPDYRRLAEYLLAPLRRQTTLDLMRCYFYYCPPWMSEKPTEAELRRMAAHEKFAAEIEGNDRWQLRLGKLERRREGDKQVFAQKRVDVQLSVDLVHHAAAGHIQHAIVIAGDSDFIPAIVAAKESGATVTLWCDNDKSVHRDLLNEVDEVHFIDWKTFPQVKETKAAKSARDQMSELERQVVREDQQPAPGSGRGSGGRGGRGRGRGRTQSSQAANGSNAAESARAAEEATRRAQPESRARASEAAPLRDRPSSQPSVSAAEPPARAQPPVVAALEHASGSAPTGEAEVSVEAGTPEEKKPGRRRRRGGRGRRGKGKGPATPTEA